MLVLFATQHYIKANRYVKNVGKKYDGMRKDDSEMTIEEAREILDEEILENFYHEKSEVKEAMKVAVDILQKQIEVEPITTYKCPNCRNILYTGQSICAECGQRIYWKKK